MTVSAARLFAPIAHQRPASLGAPQEPASPGAGAASKAKTGRTELVDQLLSKGVYEWAKEARLEKLKKMITHQIMTERGLKPGDMNDALAAEIARMVEERVKQTLQDAVERKTQAGGQPQAVIIDVMA